MRGNSASRAIPIELECPPALVSFELASAESHVLPSQVVTPCQPPSTKKSCILLHILAKRGWTEYGAHNWTKYEELCRTSVQLAKSFPMQVGIDLRNDRGLTPLMSAVSSGNDTMAFELVRVKCDINAVHNTEGHPDRTAMDMAACAKRSDIIEHLKRHGGYGLCTKGRWGGYKQKRSRKG